MSDTIFMVVFQSRVPCKTLFPFWRGKKVIIITKKWNLLENYEKRGNLIKSLFFRETGEHVRNMFFPCPQLTKGLSEFSKVVGNFNWSDVGMEEIPMKGLDPTCIDGALRRGGAHRKETTRTPTPSHTLKLTSLPLTLTSLPLYPTSLPFTSHPLHTSPTSLVCHSPIRMRIPLGSITPFAI